MRFDRLDLNLLVALDVLIEERSVSAASRRLNLSQPAVSGALQRLRDYFDDELLVQSGRRMLLTPKAEELASPVRRALMHIRAEITRPGAFDPATACRRFTIVASDYAFTILLASVVVEAARVAPAVSFEILPPDTLAGERLERAEVDIMFTVQPFTLAAHPHRALFRDEECVISWKAAGYPDRLNQDAFFDAGHAIALFGPGRQQAWAEIQLNKLGRDRRVELLLPNFAALPQAIVGTRRLATMHRLYAEHFAELYPIRLHPLPVVLPDIVEVVQWHHIRDKDPGIQWLLTLVADRVSDLPRQSQLGVEAST